MPTQGNLFGGVGAPIGQSIFDPIASANPANAMSPAQRSAMTFMQNPTQPRQFGVPSNPAGPRAQMAFDFSRSSPKSFGIGKRFAKGFTRGLKGALTTPALLAEGVFAAAIVTGSTITGSAQWGAPTGLEEDYVGGAVYGAVKGIGTATGGAVGGITGFAAGAGIGTLIFPGVGTIVGGLIGAAGGIVGGLTGESIGTNLAQGTARQLGLGARAIVKTARAIDRVQFGGNFVDSRGAQTMRQRAVAEMSGSMLNARQFLGNEAIFLHER